MEINLQFNLLIYFILFKFAIWPNELKIKIDKDKIINILTDIEA